MEGHCSWNSQLWQLSLRWMKNINSILNMFQNGIFVDEHGPGVHSCGEISSERYRYQWGVPKKGNIILLTIWCILRWYIVTFDKTKQLWAYLMSKKNLHHFLFMSVTLTFWVLRPFWALKSDLASVIALQLQHFVCQTFWYIKIRNPSTNKKVIPQNVKWYRFPKGLLC